MKWTLACSRSGVTLLLALSCSASSSINTPTDIDSEMSWGVRKRRREYFKIKWHETILVYRICMHQCCVVCTVSQTKSSTFNSSNYKRKRWMKFHISKWRKNKKKNKTTKCCWNSCSWLLVGMRQTITFFLRAVTRTYIHTHTNSFRHVCIQLKSRLCEIRHDRPWKIAAVKWNSKSVLSE